MSSALATAADEVTARLNIATFSQAFTATRTHLPTFNREDMAALHVTVVPRGIAMQQVTRADVQHDYRVDIAVQQSVDPMSNTAVDALLTLVEEIADDMTGRMFDSGARVMTIENEPVADAESLREHHLFVSILTLTLRKLR